MKLSTRARYALRAMIVISRETRDGTPVKLADVARRTGISKRYLEQVAISLKNAKLLKAVQGLHGGHLLSRPPDEITLREIVEASIGEIKIVECVGDHDACMRTESCECHQLYCMVNQRISQSLEQFTLADLEKGKISA